MIAHAKYNGGAPVAEEAQIASQIPEASRISAKSGMLETVTLSQKL